MTKKLDELFNMGDPEDSDDQDEKIEETNPEKPKNEIRQYKTTEKDIDIIDAALPLVDDLAANDAEMDELAKSAKQAFDDLMDLGMNVEARYAGKIYESAAQMLGHSISAKNAKIDKKLKMIDMQLKKRRLDQQEANREEGESVDGQGVELDRNSLMKMLRNNRDEKS